MSITEGLASRMLSAYLLNQPRRCPFIKRILKNIQAKKIFLITAQNKATVQRKQTNCAFRT